MDKIKFKKLSDNAKIPTRGSEFSVGLDLYSAEYCWVPPRSRELVKTNLAVEIPVGYYGRIAPRSGLAWKSGIDIFAGVIDPDYRGNIGIIVYNSSDSTFEIKEGDKIAQFIFEKCEILEPEEVDVLEDTKRGEGGFGSTGK